MIPSESSESPQDPVPGQDDSAAGNEAEGTLRKQILDVLEMIRPAVQDDGGDIELVEVREDGTVSIRFLGACIGCPSSEITLREGIARNLRERVPGVTSVVAVD